MTVTVYKTPTCVACPPTLKWFEKYGIEPEVVEINSGADMPEDVQALGYMSAPVVVVRSALAYEGVDSIIDSWSGFRPDRIDAYAASL